MIKRNKCNFSGCESFVYSKKLCLYHYKQEHPEKFVIKKSDKPIKHQSDREAERLSKYRIIRDTFLKDKICEFPDCNSKEVECHHANSRIGEALYNDLKALCHFHHMFIHDQPLIGRELGLLK